MIYTNNLTLVRLVLALIVVFVHFYTLININNWLIEYALVSSRFAVEAFFVISGYLIFMSYENSSKFTDYLGKRLYRIYPAYFVVILSCSFLLFFLSTKPFYEYFSKEFFEYLTSNLVMLNFLSPTLPGVFVENTSSAVNGALWTLKIEIIFYLFVPIIVYFIKRYGFFKTFCFSYFISESYIFFIGMLVEQNEGLSVLMHQFPAQLRFFMFGSLFYYYAKLFKNKRFTLLALGILFVVVNIIFDYSFLRPLSSGLLIMVLSLYFPFYSIDKFGDYSYGIYIFHYPLIQSFIALGLISKLGLFYFSILFIIILCFIAYLSCHFVENKFKYKKNKSNK